MGFSFPSTIIGKIEFFENRIAAWAADPAAIGLTPAQIGDLQTLVSQARTRYTNAQNIRQESKDATTLQNAAVRDMVDQGTSMIALIRAHAELAADPETVFTSANLDMPSDNAAPLPAPVAATDLRTNLLNTGAVKISWKGTVANGTVYSVWRRIGENNPYIQIGTATGRSFVDETIPVGTAEASYYTIAHRDALSSPVSESVGIRFGVTDPGLTGGGGASLGLAA